MNKLLKVLLAGLLLAAPALQAQIEINENLTISGFLDMSLVNTDSERTGLEDTSYNLDQAEIDFIFNFDELTGQVDLNYLGDNGTDEFDLEQAFLNWDFGDGSSIDAGKYRSYLGFEAFEPTGLYQYSTAYDIIDLRPGHHNGVRYNYTDDFVSFGLSLVDSVFAPDGSIEDSNYGVEAKIALFPVDGLTIQLGAARDSMGNTLADRDLINFWASYEIENMTYAVELSQYDFGVERFGRNEGSQWLLMANMGITDNFGITGRVSEDTQDFKGGDTATKFTISPNWTIHDNLGMLLEISETDYGSEGTDRTIAFETIFTF